MVSPVVPVAKPLEVVIASGASLSAATALNGHTLIGIIMPAAWTAANLTFQMSDLAGGTYVDVYGIDEAELEVTAAASRYLALDPVNWYGVDHLKVRSGTAATPVNQAADRTLKLMVAVDRRR